MQGQPPIEHVVSVLRDIAKAEGRPICARAADEIERLHGEVEAMREERKQHDRAKMFPSCGCKSEWRGQTLHVSVCAKHMAEMSPIRTNEQGEKS